MKKITLEQFYKLSYKEQRKFSGIVKWPYGYITYFKNGVYHREDGPAVIWNDINRKFYYYLNGQYIENCHSDEALQLYLDILKLKGNK
jgi:hypothetical protein